MEIEERILLFVTRANWVLLALASVFSLSLSSPSFAAGVIAGGLIVTVNFHLLYRSLKKALRPPYIAVTQKVLGKYYLRLIATGVILIILISGGYADPLGLIAGLSVVVASMLAAAFREIFRIFQRNG